MQTVPLFQKAQREGIIGKGAGTIDLERLGKRGERREIEAEMIYF